jgi:hypothetical protein
MQEGWSKKMNHTNVIRVLCLFNSRRCSEITTDVGKIIGIAIMKIQDVTISGYHLT